MPDQASLTRKEQELIAIGAAIAAGCKPCTAFHFKAAAAEGATQGEIRRAVDLALEARRSAAALMSQLAERLLAEIPEAGIPSASAAACVEPLVCAGAALAINCGPDLTRHLNRARDLGASDSQVRSAFDIARAVKTMAGKRAEAAAARTGAGVRLVTGEESHPPSCGAGIPGNLDRSSVSRNPHGGGRPCGSPDVRLTREPIDEGPEAGLL